MGFKFLNNKEDLDGPMELIFNDEPNQLRLSTNNRPSVFLNLNRDRDTISDDEWNSIIKRQRAQLIEYMYEEGMVMHTIISQDDFGLTLRTEILF